MDAPPTTGPDTERKPLPTRSDIWAYVHKPPCEKRVLVSRRRDDTDERWHRDFKGHEKGWLCHPLRNFRRRLIVYIVVFGFLLTMGLILFGENTGATIVSIVLVLILIVLMWDFVRKLVHSLRAGTTHLNYDTFPYFLGEPLKAHWSSRRRYDRSDQLVFTLRCIQTVWEGTGESRAAHLYQCWADEYTVSRHQASGRDTRIPIEFRLPFGLPTTRLKDADPYHWEVEVCVHRTRRMTVGYYRVPVYEKPWVSKKAEVAAAQLHRPGTSNA